MTVLRSLALVFNSVNDKITSITVETVSANGITVAAGGVGDVSIDCSKTGYTFLGVVGWVVNSGGACTAVYLDTATANTAKLRLRNNGSSSITTGSIGVRALYIKT